MPPKLIAAFAAMAMICWSAISIAADVTFYYGGRITAAGSASSTPLNVDDLFSGSYTFDSAATDYDGSSSASRYALTTFSLTFGGTTYAGSASGDGIGLRDGSSSDWYSVGEYFGDGSASTGPADWIPQGVLIFLSDEDATIFDSVPAPWGSPALPMTPPSLSEFEGNEVIFELVAREQIGSIEDEDNPGEWIPSYVTHWDGDARGVLTYLSTTPPVAAIPEPETYAMLLAGLGKL